MDLAAYDLAAIGASVERIPSRRRTGYPLLGDCIRATFPHPKASQPGILISGHMDTVHPVGTLADLPFKRDGGQCWGPGIQDMKGGNFLSLEAIRQLQQAGIQTPLPLTVLFRKTKSLCVGSGTHPTGWWRGLGSIRDCSLQPGNPWRTHTRRRRSTPGPICGKGNGTTSF